MTHMAICASQDWARVDRIVVGNFVTASQAQRKWYTKVIASVAAGGYRLGAVSLACFSLFCSRLGLGCCVKECDADGFVWCL